MLARHVLALPCHQELRERELAAARLALGRIEAAMAAVLHRTPEERPTTATAFVDALRVARTAGVFQQQRVVEITRDTAEKFNRVYGETFKLPEDSYLKYLDLVASAVAADVALAAPPTPGRPCARRRRAPSG